LAAVPSLGRATEVERSVAPEADATRALYERYSGPLYSFCLHRLGSREEAEDAVQTTFLNAFRGLQRGIVPAAESAWLFKIAENVCLTRHRSAWRRGRIESPSDMQALQDMLPARERNGDELIPLGDALAGMPEGQQRALVMREWQGLSYREIATEMSLSQSAVETLIFRARRSLATALETPWERGGARRAGRRAFDLGSLLAGLKTFVAGSTAAKVAVVAAAAVGTATVAVADHHQAPVSRRTAEPLAAVAVTPSAVSGAAAVGVGAPERLDATTAGDPRRGGVAEDARSASATKATVKGNMAATTSAAGGAASKPGTRGRSNAASKSNPTHPAQSRRPATPPGQAKEPGTHAVPPARAAKAKPQAAPRSAAAKTKPQATQAAKDPKEPKAATPPPPPAAPTAGNDSGDSEKDKGKDK
jgi:RNA polymerase sigma factor (sigma-70 family)